MNVNPSMPAEHEVHQHQVDPLVGDRGQRVLGVRVLQDLVALVLQGQRQGAADPVVVLEHEQPGSHRPMLPGGSAPAARTGGLSAGRQQTAKKRTARSQRSGARMMT